MTMPDSLAETDQDSVVTISYEATCDQYPDLVAHELAHVRQIEDYGSLHAAAEALGKKGIECDADRRAGTDWYGC
jgi:hypothetical protein